MESSRSCCRVIYVAALPQLQCALPVYCICLHRYQTLPLISSRHSALHVSESAAAQPSWIWMAWPKPDKRPGVLCVTVCTVYVSCMHAHMYGSTCHVSAMIACGTTIQHPSRHANNIHEQGHSHTGELACAGHPITADRMPRTEQLQPSLRSLAYCPPRPAATGSGPCSICILTRRPSQSLHLAPLYTLQPCVPRWLRSPI